MARIDIKNLPDEIIFALDEEAKNNKMSRNKYITELLIAHVELKQLKSEYQEIEIEFYEKILPVMEKQNQLLEALVNKF